MFNGKTIKIHDSIYNNIEIPAFVIPIIDTVAFQRLKYINQLGGLYNYYPNANHNRFVHSCGVFYLACQLIKNNSFYSKLSEYKKKLLILSALLHDIGHGPWSHTFEKITKIRHEEYSKQIILENKELNNILNKINPKLANDIVLVLDKKYKHKYISNIISSTIDIDRLDYVLRDSFHTGFSYKKIEWRKLLTGIVIDNNEVVFSRNLSIVLESFISNRYHLFVQFFYNPKNTAIDIHLLCIIKRVAFLLLQKYKFKITIHPLIEKILLKGDLNADEYLYLDDNTFNTFIKNLAFEEDKILNKMVDCFRKRKFYNYKIFKTNDEMKQFINKLNYTDEEKKNYIYISEEKTLMLFNKDNLNDKINSYDKDNNIINLLQSNPIILEHLKKRNALINKYAGSGMFYINHE